MKKKVLIIVPALIVLGVAAVVKLIAVHNGLAAQCDAVSAQWARVDAALDGRAELIPSMMEAVKEAAPHEDPLFEKLEKARSALAGAHAPQDRVKANDRLSGALARLLVVTENYPQMRKSRNFLRLLDEIAASENRIAIERRKYNEILEHYNAQIQIFPDNVVASIYGFRRNDAYFRTDGADGGAKVQF